MNLQNLDHAIAIMKRAGKVDMNFWQSGNIKQTEESKHACGSAACFAGWVAISPEWESAGGFTSRSGTPRFNGSDGSDALGEWLDIPEILSDSFVNGDAYDIGNKFFSAFYNKFWDDVNKEDVITKLEFLRDNGVKALLEQNLEVLKNTINDTNSVFKLTDYDTTCLKGDIAGYQEVLLTL